MTTRIGEPLIRGLEIDPPSPRAARIVFIAARSPLSRLMASALVAQYDQVFCPQFCWQDVAGVRPLRAGVLPGIEPILALVTWADLLYDAAESVASRIEASIDSIVRSIGLGPLTLCLVPFGSFLEGRLHVYEFLHCGEAFPEPPHAAFERLITRLSGRGLRARFVLAPMLIAREIDRSSGYPSLLQKLVRVGVALRDEALTKVPSYFSRFNLTVLTSGRPGPNVTTPAELAWWLAGEAAVTDSSEDAPPTLDLDSPANWTEVARVLRDTSRLSMCFTEDGSECNALDDVLHAATMSYRDLHSELFRNEVEEARTRTLTAHGALETLGHIASAPVEDWESSYTLVGALESEDVGGLLTRRTRATQYFAGGVGPCLLLLVPFGVDIGYYAGIARDLAHDHKVVVWRPIGNHIEHLERDSAELRDALSAEGVDEFNIVAWCGGVRLAARLADDYGPRLRSMCLLAPELNAGEDQSDLYKSVVRFFDQIREYAGNADEIVARARQSWRDSARLTPSANLEQYGPRMRRPRSPLQYHPEDFRSQAAEDLFGDTRRVLDVAQALAVRNDAEIAAERLRQYPGPVVVISGTNDALIRYKGVRDQCGRSAGWTLVTLLGGNHYLVAEHGGAISRLLREFVRTGDVIPAGGHVVTGERIRVERAPFSAGAPPSI